MALSCLVYRSWDQTFDARIWNPKWRAPIFFNDAASATVLPTYLEHAEWALSGLSK